MHIVLLVAVILRFTLTTDSDFMWARYFYAINLVMFYLRMLHLFYIHPELGPDVIAIRRMVCVVVVEKGRHDIKYVISYCQDQLFRVVQYGNASELYN